MSSRIHRAQLIDDQFTRRVESLNDVQIVRGELAGGLSNDDLLALFDSQLKSRQIDLMARVKRAENKVFYTIGSSGHEGNAMVGRLTRETDPAFLHYRSGAFMAERYRKMAELDFIQDTALSFAASTRDPASGGRHKVWGHPDLWVLPQTSTIASHLPKALGTALALESAGGIGHKLPVPNDAIVVCSFGDGSFSHATAQTAFNASAWTRHQNLRCPILFVCEDNGWGISVPTPTGFIEESVRARYGLRYVRANGVDLEAGYSAVADAIDYVRHKRQPVFLHLKTVRLMGHAGTDFEIEYRSDADLMASESQDPLLKTAETVVARGLMTPAEILAKYEALRIACLDAADAADLTPRLASREDIMAPLAPLSMPAVKKEMRRNTGWDKARMAVWGERLPEKSKPSHMAVLINHALHDLLIKYPQAIVFGEDVAKKGGVYTVTKGLWSQFGRRRVFNTLLDETTILGLAQGYGSMGFLPMPEIQYLAYFHNAGDQIRGEACSLQFFSNNQFRNPMVMRIAGLGYQKGFGGHFHNDNSMTALRDIPSLIIGCPSRGDDAVMMLRTMMALAHIDGRVCAMIEPIALYMRKDLSVPDDREWSFHYPAPDKALTPFEPRVYGDDGADLLIITYGNGVPMALNVRRALQTGNVKVSVLDLRWIKPLPITQVLANASQAKHVLVVDEGRPNGSIGESVMSALAQNAINKSLHLLTAPDTYIPLANAAEVTLLSEAEILDKARGLLTL